MIIHFEHEVIKWEDSQIPINKTKLAGKNNKKIIKCKIFNKLQNLKLYTKLQQE